MANHVSADSPFVGTSIRGSACQQLKGHAAEFTRQVSVWRVRSAGLVKACHVSELPTFTKTIPPVSWHT